MPRRLLTEEDYQKALSMLLKYFDAKPNTVRGKIFELLANQIEDYENIHFNLEEFPD